MEHIKGLLAKRQLTLFARPKEKGSREWGVFDMVRDDRVSMFDVATPRHKETLTETTHSVSYRPREWRFGTAH